MVLTNAEIHQQQTFLKWANFYLSRKGLPEYSDLSEILEKDGILVLVESLSNKKIFRKSMIVINDYNL